MVNFEQVKMPTEDGNELNYQLNFGFIVMKRIGSQVFTNCVHGRNRARNVQANGVTPTRQVVRVIDSLCKNKGRQCLFSLAWPPF